MNAELDASFQQCRDIARRHARNFYYSFVLLPKAKRDAMCAVYAFMRCADDLSDAESDTQTRRASLHAWRRGLHRAWAGDQSGSPVLPALCASLERFSIPQRLIDDLLTGVEMDLDVSRYATPDELYNYCYHVAGVVGMVCLRIWGAADLAHADRLSEACGRAFQLTNVLRDVKEDFARGRVYVPRSILDSSGCPEVALGGTVVTPNLRDALANLAAEATRFYDEAAQLAEMVSPDSRASFLTMYRVYRRLLTEIVRRDYDVLRTRITIPPLAKAGIVVHALAHKAAFACTPNRA